MSLNQWIRKLDRKFTGLTIELVAHDRFSLGSRICDLTENDLQLLEWSDEQRRDLYSGLMARNPRGYVGWHPSDEELVPVTLRRSEWRMIASLCAHLIRAAPETWHVRVVERITVRLRPLSEPADHR